MDLMITRKKEIRNIPNGKHKGVIENLVIKDEENGKKLILVVYVNHKGAVAKLYYTTYISWYDDSSFISLLEKFEILEDVGQDIDLSRLLSKPVNLEVENNSVNGKTYSNIKEIDLDKEELKKIEKENNKKSKEAEEIFQND
ncbi:MAG: hypothetical protein N4A48_00020 [Tepidibacter sp.]|jgi:hypothetical protein|uniref:hypothetical protein n=1 Tax=Tepidibacter sp. TaxID=2529387 RepID=UPI0025F0BC62|nr:hypothetical protein [Tepidibacter sp.]MCT4507149.1 hypothetical protein [Tepidibacter sp.]MCT4585448.1 hypothetical protein [Peptostreptococcaceae bacterium]